MAVYHLSARILSRKAGRSATAAAAYRCGEKITDQRTGEVHDYTRKRGIEHAEIVMPSGSEWRPARAELWNAVEAKNKRADAQVAREFVVALPAELSRAGRVRLVVDFAREIADRYGVAADVAIHAPDRKGDQRNHHAHILTTTNRVQQQGLGNKVRELDLVAHNMGGKVGQANEIERLRERWAELSNERLREAGIGARIDHRSLAAQGIGREPARHLGPAAVGYERRTGESSDKRIQQQRAAAERLARARQAGELERQDQQVERSILDLSGDIEAAKRERDRQVAAQALVRRREEVPASLAQGRAIVAQQLGGQARLVEAQRDSGYYYGQIIAEVPHHLIQQSSPLQAVAHLKAGLEHVQVGAHVSIVYSSERVTVKPMRAREQSRGRGR